MPQYLAPGVYVEEVSSGIKPIAGVGTSTAGVVGAVTDDVELPLLPGSTDTRYPPPPAAEARLVTSWEAFTRQFGNLQPGNLTLAHAVYGFFNNGGSRCWVARVAPDAAPAARAPRKPAAAADPAAAATAPAVATDPPDIDTIATSAVTAALDSFK